MSHSIDFVVMWVDGNDPAWRKKKNTYNTSVNSHEDDSEVRYRDWDNLEIWLKSVDCFAPWVRNIYLVTDNQEPDFISKYPKVKLVDHQDYIPHEYLPTFNSHTIELNVHRIDGLSEQFVLFNDDMFIIRPVEPNDFFDEGKPKDVYGLNVVAGIGVKEIIQNITLNDVSVVNAHFNKRKQMKQHRSKWYSFKNGPYLIRTLLLRPWGFFAGFVEPHIANSFLKSTFSEVWEKEYVVLHQSSLHRFRNVGDVNQWLMRYWQLASGISQNRKHSFGAHFDLEDGNVETCMNWIEQQKSALVCINDKASISDFDAVKKVINDALERVIERGSK